MKLQALEGDFTVCQVEDFSRVDWQSLCFTARTDREWSLLCRTDKAPSNTTAREDGWRALRVAGTLDFSLTGILSKLATVLADAGVGIFAVSTYDTDYILVKAENLDRATAALNKAGYALQGIPAEL